MEALVCGGKILGLQYRGLYARFRGVNLVGCSESRSMKRCVQASQGSQKPSNMGATLIAYSAQLTQHVRTPIPQSHILQTHATE